MGRKKKVDEKREPQIRKQSQIAIERRRDLQEAAIRSISQYGYGAVTVATICEEAGFSRGLIGHYFKGKDALVMEAVQMITSDLALATRKAVEAAGEDPVKRLHAVVRASFTAPGFTREKVSVWIAVSGAARWSEPLTAIYRDLWRNYRVGIERLMTRAAKECGLTFDPEIAALVFSQLVEGLWMSWAVDSIAVTTEKAEASCHAYLDLLFGSRRAATKYV